MSLFINNNSGPIYNDCNVTIHNGQTTVQTPEDITPSEDSSFPSDNLSDISNSIIFTKKAKAEHKEPYIIQALQKSVHGRNDKIRAFVHELHDWQNQAYVDAHYNARVMYDELEKLMPLSFGYDGFKRLYNNSRN